MKNKLDLTLKLKPLLDGVIIEPSNSSSANAEEPDAWLSNDDKQLLQNLSDIHLDLHDTNVAEPSDELNIQKTIYKISEIVIQQKENYFNLKTSSGLTKLCNGDVIVTSFGSFEVEILTKQEMSDFGERVDSSCETEGIKDDIHCWNSSQQLPVSKLSSINLNEKDFFGINTSHQNHEDDPLIFLYNGHLSQSSMSTLEHIIPRGSGIGALPNQAIATIKSLMPNMSIQQKFEDALTVTTNPKFYPARAADESLEKNYDIENLQGNILGDLGISTQSSAIANMNINAKATNQLVAKNSVFEQAPIDILDEYLVGETSIASESQHGYEAYFNKSVYHKTQLIKILETYTSRTIHFIKKWKKQIIS